MSGDLFKKFGTVLPSSTEHFTAIDDEPAGLTDARPGKARLRGPPYTEQVRYQLLYFVIQVICTVDVMVYL